MRHQSHQREESKQRRRRALDGWPAPLALRLNSQVRPAFAERVFDLPNVVENEVLEANLDLK